MLRAQQFIGREGKMILGSLGVGKLTGIVLAAPDTLCSMESERKMTVSLKVLEDQLLALLMISLPVCIDASTQGAGRDKRQQAKEKAAKTD